MALNELLIELGISKVRLAKYLGVSRQMLYNYLAQKNLNDRPKEKAMKILRVKLYDLMEQEKEQKLGSTRKSKIGTGDRSEKIRTYNYPQNRVTDHRIGFSVMSLDRVMDGELDPIIEALITEDLKRKLAGE